MNKRTVENRLRRDPLPKEMWGAMGRPRCVLVGGYVRDRALGRASRDLDFSVTGSVDQVGFHARQLAKVFHTRAHLLGRPPRAVWQLEADGTKIELWPLTSTSRRDDILRRDFTCNALAWTLPNGPLIDLVGGLASIRDREIKAIRPENLERDPIRLLRAARMVAQLEGFSIEENTQQIIRSLSTALGSSPKERIGQEISSLLRSPRAATGVKALIDLGLFSHTGPRRSAVDLEWVGKCGAATDWIGSPNTHPFRAAAGSDPDTASLAWLFRAWRVDDHRTVGGYGWPRSARRQATRVAALLEEAARAIHAGSGSRREIIFRANHAFPALFSAASAIDIQSASENTRLWRRWWQQWKRSGERILNPNRFVSPHEVAEALSCEPGPKLGELLEQLDIQIARGRIRSDAGAHRWLRTMSLRKPRARTTNTSG